MRGCLKHDHEGKVVTPYGIFVLGVVRGMRVGVCLVEMIIFDVVRVVT